MKNAWIIASKDIKEALRSRTTYLYILLLIAISFSFFGEFYGIINGAVRRGANIVALTATAGSVVGMLVSTLPLVFTMFFSYYLSNYSIVNDKSKRVLESLLATPLSLRQVWFGKTLAVTLPSVLIAIILSIFALFLMNRILLMPVVGRFIMPGFTQITAGLILVPVISFLVTLVVTLLQLIINNPRIANFAFMALFFLVFLTPTVPVIRSVNITVVYLLFTGVLVLLNVLLSRLLTKERVILSSKG